MNHRRFAAAVSIAAVALLTACGAPSEIAPTPSFTPLADAPPEPPAVAIQGAEVPASYYEWVIDREAVTFKAAEDQDDVALPSVPSGDMARTTIDVGSPVAPADFVVVFFNELDPSGKPVESSAETVDCLRESTRCEVLTTDQGLSATVDLERSANAIVVVHLMYISDARTKQQVEHLVGAWGARVEG